MLSLTMVLHGVACVVLVMAQATPVVFMPTDAIGFDYADAEFTAAQVTHFERKSNNGSWVDIGIPAVVPGAPAGWHTYKFQPTAAFDQVTTIWFRACNAGGCSVSSDPFTFVRVSSVPPTVASPTNVRRLGGTGP